jgi:flagellar protein FlaI
VGLIDRLRKKTVPERVDLGISRQEPKDDFKLIEKYYVTNPHAQILIYQDPDVGAGFRYFIDEVDLNESELKVYYKLTKIVSKELEPPTDLTVDPVTHLRDQTKILSQKYRRTLGKIEEDSWSRVLYYIVRDIVGYGALDPLLRDPNIEDISCNGLNKTIFVWHRKYESIPTNIAFSEERVYNDFIIKLAHKGSKHISSAHPVLDATLPEKHRMAATFQKEVSTLGSSFCIRKFREDPLSIVDLTRFGTLPPKLAAYFWMLLENRMNFMTLGGTGAGKTSMLNALLSMISPNDKIITVEEVAELNPPHENWVPLVSRKGFTFGTAGGSSIDLFDLVKLSLRYRPDYIVVGEVRGEEAYTLFQAIATGHGGICTMHADSLDHAVKRLTSEPMNIAKVYIPLMNIAMYISRVELPYERMGLKFGRRVRVVWEIEDFEKYVLISQWDPTDDTFKIDLTKSVKLKEISDTKGISFESLLDEVDRRAKLLINMVKLDAREQGEVVRRFQEYLKAGEIGFFQKGVPDRRLVEATVTIRGHDYTIWRYPKGAFDIEKWKKIGGRIVARGG